MLYNNVYQLFSYLYFLNILNTTRGDISVSIYYRADNWAFFKKKQKKHTVSICTKADLPRQSKFYFNFEVFLAFVAHPTIPL